MSAMCAILKNAKLAKIRNIIDIPITENLFLIAITKKTGEMEHEWTIFFIFAQ